MKGMKAMLRLPILLTRFKKKKIRKNVSFPLSPQVAFPKLALFLSALCLGILLLPSLFSLAQNTFNLSVDSLKKWTHRFSVETLLTALTMELPPLGQALQSQVTLPKVSNILVEMATTLNPEDPRTLIRSEIPGFSYYDQDLIIAGQGVSYATLSYESSPPLKVVLAEREAVLEELEKEENEKGEEKGVAPPLTTEGRKVVFIYHTHNRESWLPHLPSAKTADEAYHEKVNIVKVGLKLGEELEKRGIGTQVDQTDIGRILAQKDRSFGASYDESRRVVEAALQKNKDIVYMFDLHRDAAPREHTTFEMNGKAYARPFFIIGKNNPHYEKNIRFAEKLNNLLEERYPGLSRGVLARQSGHGEYNQSLSEHNVLIEIGGVENTLEESYRTAEILAEVIADLYWEAEKVDVQKESPKKEK